MKTITCNPNNYFKRYLSVIILVLVTSCGGTDGTQVADGGISGTGISAKGISSGSITGTGSSSVILNDRELEITTQTEIFVDQQPATEADLKVGFVVRVDADFDTNTAERIDFLETVRGPLVAVPLVNPDTLVGSFSLLGQSVVTNSVTVLDGITDLLALNIDEVLEVSGVRDSNGAIIARYISLKTAVTEYRVLGAVANADPASMKFTIGALSIDYSSADLGELGTVGIENGAELHVKGLSSSFDSVANTFLANKITPSPLAVELVSGSDVELEGVITDFQSISDFEVDGIKVDASSANFENGIATDLQLDLLVEIEGSVDDSNGLIASKVKIIPLSNIRVESTVESVDVANQSIVIHEQVFNLDDKTQLEDKSSDDIAGFSLSDLSAGNWVEIRGFRLNGQFFLTRLERNDPGTDVRIQAPVDSVDQSNKTVTILGIKISTNIDTDYEDINDDPSDETVFFSTVMEGDLVKARWKDSTNITLPVDGLSFED